MRGIKKVNIHAGHTSETGMAPGAVGFLNESTEARKVTKKVISLLRSDGIAVYDCTAEGANTSDNLVKIVNKCNAHKVDLDVSIHLNSGRNDKKGDKKTGGVEVLMVSTSGIRGEVGTDICSRVSNLGFTNRGLKIRNDLYVLNRTNSPAILVECCFVDDKDDADLYDYKDMAKMIASGIVGHYIYNKPTVKVNKKSKTYHIKWLQQHLNACITKKGFKKLKVNGIWSAELTTALLVYWKQLGWNKDGKNKGKAAGLKTIKALAAYRKK